jgi:hypothetical protein
VILAEEHDVLYGSRGKLLTAASLEIDLKRLLPDSNKMPWGILFV